MADSKLTEADWHGQIRAWKIMFSYVDSMLLRSAVDLRLADIIHAQPGLSLSGIASRLSPPPSDLSRLRRVMRYLVRNGVFSAATDEAGTGEMLYGPTTTSRWLMRNSGLSIASFILSQSALNGPSHWSKLSEAMFSHEIPYRLMYGKDFWSVAVADPELNEIFNAGMASTTELMMNEVLAAYKDKLAELRSIVDVGGGVGAVLGKITKVCPKLQGINFDLPHVVAGAPEYPNVVHVGGSMFDEIPKADAVFMKWILHNHGDEECLKVLANCRKAIPENTGKLIIVEMVLDPEDDGPLADIGMALDMVMLSFCTGKERTEIEWRELLKAAGFQLGNIIQLRAIVSIIEAYPTLSPF